MILICSNWRKSWKKTRRMKCYMTLLKIWISAELLSLHKVVIFQNEFKNNFYHLLWFMFDCLRSFAKVRTFWEANITWEKFSSWFWRLQSKSADLSIPRGRFFQIWCVSQKVGTLLIKIKVYYYDWNKLYLAKSLGSRIWHLIWVSLRWKWVGWPFSESFELKVKLVKNVIRSCQLK